MATKRDWYKAAALALRDRIVHRWLTAEKQNYDAGRKRVYYLSLEFLIGRLFTDALNNMGLLPVFEAALGDLGVDLSDLRKCEPDAALGNGGLGRLAACFMESMATLAIPAIGYGIRYDFGLFRQIIAQGWQQEYPDEWLGFGNPWEFQRPEVVYHVHFGGQRRPCRRPRPRPRQLASGGNRAGGRLRHPDRRLARPARQRAAAVVGALARSAAARCLQHRRLSRRGRRGSARGIDLQIPLSERRERGGPRIAAAPGIFLRLRLAAGPGQAAPRRRRAVAQPRPKGRGAAQRHPSEPCRHRADADPGRPAQFPLGRGLEDHGRDAVLHQPHAAAGGAGDLAGRTVRAAAAAASRNHLPHQRRASGAGRRALPRRHRFPRLGVADRRELRTAGADGATGLRRLAPHQRRLGDAFRPDEGDRVPRSQPSLSLAASPTRPTASPSGAG